MVVSFKVCAARKRLRLREGYLLNAKRPVDVAGQGSLVG